ncbi:MAG: response regulator [bacterium]|nr:response regulator [bacterium]
MVFVEVIGTTSKAKVKQMKEHTLKENKTVEPSHPEQFKQLAGAKQIAGDTSLSKEALLNEYKALITGFEGILKQYTENNREPEKETTAGKDLSAERAATRKRLLTHITHEFLTPLNLIVTPLERLVADCRDPEEKEMYSMMHRNGMQLLLLISQLLDLLKLENMKLRAIHCNIVSFLKAGLSSFEKLAADKNIKLVFEADEERIPLYFEPGMITEMLCNFVMNGLEHTPSDGRIRVGVRRAQHGWLEITIHYAGTEVTLNHTGRVFNRFYHFSRRVDSFSEGPGIGLFLAEEYVGLHHGTIHMNSSTSLGTEFVIRLPEGRAHLADDEIKKLPVAANSLETAADISRRYDFMELGDKADIETPQPPVADTKDQDIVLVVDDNKDMRGFIKELLIDAQFIVAEAANGRQGFEVAKVIVPDLIISDIMMPEMDGYQLCATLKKDIKTSHIPIVLLSVKFSDSEISRGLKVGADDYITKPFSMEIFLNRIKNLVNKRRHLQQRVQMEMGIHPGNSSLSTIDATLLAEIKKEVEKNISNTEFDLEDMANSLYLSRASLYRKVKSLTGQSPNRFIQSYRLTRALELLKANAGTVTEVAQRVGFSSSAYFTKCFKDKFHHLPSQYHDAQHAS